MRTKADRRFALCLLLCFLFIAGYISCGVSVIAFSLPGVSEPLSSFLGADYAASSMKSAARAGLDYIEMENLSFEFNIFQTKQTRRTSLGTNSLFFAAVITALAALLAYYSNLSDKVYAHSNSSRITDFLHKKDGMK